VVVIHEVFGLTENIKDITQRFADAGYAALAVDLFTGRNRVVCMVRFLADIFTNALDHGGIHDLKAALTFLAEQPNVDAEKLGAIGFCLGGGFAVAWACTDERLKVIAPYYGANPRPLEAVARVCPVVGSYPSQDFTAKSGRKLEAALTQYDVDHDIKIYEGAKHSFFNDRSRMYDADAAIDSWQRVLAFFEAYLGTGEMQ
jgi:carboxymethylenebutenolidase